MPACDTVSIGGGGTSGPQPVITTATAEIGSSADTVETTLSITNEGDEFWHGTATVDTGFDTSTLEMDIGAGTTGTTTDTFTGAPDGTHTVLFTAEGDNGTNDESEDTVTVDTRRGGGDRSEIQVNGLMLTNPADNKLGVEFSLVNSAVEGSGTTLDAQWEISIDGGVAESGTESGMAPGDSVTIQQDFVDVPSGDTSVSVSTQHDAANDTINISGGSGGDPVDGGSPLDDIPTEYLAAGAGIAALALIGGGSSGGGKRTVVVPPGGGRQRRSQRRQQTQATRPNNGGSQ